LDVRAADLAGAKDHPLLKRFGGSEIVAYEIKRFDAFDLQTSTFKRYNLETKQREFAGPPLKVEGARTRIWYESAGDTSATELIRNYQNELKSKGFRILYDSTQDPNATMWVNFLAPFAEMNIKTNRSYYIFYAADPKSIRVTSAKLERPEGDVYVYLTAIEWPKDDAIYKAKRGAYVAVDILEVQAMAQNMVVVSADEMSKAIAASGRVALYGILFDSNKADIKPESKPALEEIAKLLKKESDLKLHVVGHTDNVGGYEFNLNLSKRRADAVVAALVKEYGIAANRLTANGVAYLSPIAVNTNEEGRAKNRRVELVPR
jgi:outer membrane protein OmpA-like peptidoglycan-associated protein